MGIDGHRPLVNDHQRVAIRDAVGCLRGTDVAAGALLVVDDDRLAKARREMIGEPPRPDIGNATHAARHNEANRSVRPLAAVRGCDGRQCSDPAERAIQQADSMSDLKVSAVRFICRSRDAGWPIANDAGRHEVNCMRCAPEREYSGGCKRPKPLV